MEITDLNKLNIPFYDNEEQLFIWAKEHYGNKLSKAIKEHLTVEMNAEIQRKMEYATGDERQKLIETAYDIAFGDLEREVKRCTDAHKGIEGSFISTEVNHAKICLRGKYYPLYNDVMRMFNKKHPKLVDFLKKKEASLHPEKKENDKYSDFRDYLIADHEFTSKNIAKGIFFTGVIAKSKASRFNRDDILEACKLYEEYHSLNDNVKAKFLINNSGNHLFVELVAYLSAIGYSDMLDVYEIGSSTASWFEMMRDICVNECIKSGLSPDDIEFVIVSPSGEVLE